MLSRLLALMIGRCMSCDLSRPIVIAGLEPAIQRSVSASRPMDARVNGWLGVA
jgi:hypothetical protein